MFYVGYNSRRRRHVLADQRRMEINRCSGKTGHQTPGVVSSLHKKECQDLMYNVTENNCHLVNWQHQQQQQQDQDRNRFVDQFVGGTKGTNQQTHYYPPDGSSRHYHSGADHLYESPKFDRKEISTASTPGCIMGIGEQLFSGRLPPDGQFKRMSHAEEV